MSASSKYLLDVSTIVALLWKSHTHNSRAEAWAKGKALAVCPITELGFIRVVTSTAYNATMEDAREVLADWLKHNSPEFIPADLRALDGAAAPTSAKTTDWYLANLAEAKGMKWATLDTRANHPAAELID
jgi:predicted nucleic acid-binding protein